VTPLTLTPAAVVEAARRPGAAAFPFLKTALVIDPPTCCGKPATAGAGARTALAQVAALSPARKVAFKEFMGVTAIRVPVVRAGRVVWVTF
jgi:hypothetical protein